MDKQTFLYPRSRYYGTVNLENLAFDANLQDFATQVSYISALQTNGKLSPLEAYGQIKGLWHALKSSKKTLGVGENRFQAPENPL